MKTFLLIIFLLACPYLFGYGAVTIYNSIAGILRKQPNIDTGINNVGNTPSLYKLGSFCTYFPTGSLILLLIAGGTNLIAVFLELSVTSSIKLFAILTIGIASISYAVMMLIKAKTVFKKAKNISLAVDDNIVTPKLSKTATLLLVVSIIFSIALIIISVFEKTYYQGDQLIETVNSFLSSDGIYTVNPLTGLAYSGGFPARLKLQCLPLFYTILAKAFSVDAYVLLCRIMPAFWLLNGMCCFYRIGEGLFTQSTNAPKALTNSASPLSKLGKSAFTIIFYDICIFLLLCCDVAYMTTGFDAFHAGYRAGNVLALLIVNWMFGTCIKKRWIASILAIIVEPLVASSLIGLGACLVIFIGMLISTKLLNKRVPIQPTENNQTEGKCDTTSECNNLLVPQFRDVVLSDDKILDEDLLNEEAKND